MNMHATLDATNAADPELWTALSSLPLAAHDDAFPFVEKLAYQCSWTKGHAERVVAEYRRFLYLTQVATAPIAPSDAVDQAWHLHLLQTHFYWDVMCKDLLHKDLHHTPTLSGSEGHEADIARYANVLEQYKSVFGEEPPDDIWPSVSTRFVGQDSDNARASFLTSQLPRDWAFVGVLVACSVLWMPHESLTVSVDHLLLGTVSLIVLTGLALLILREYSEAVTRPKDLDAYEAAYLHGGVNHAVNTALIRLVDLGVVSFVTNGKTGDEGKAECRIVRADAVPPIFLSELEASVFKELKNSHVSLSLAQLSTRTSAAITRLQRRLQDANLLLKDGMTSGYRTLKLAIGLGGAVIGAGLWGVPTTISLGVYLTGGLVFGYLVLPLVFLFEFSNSKSTPHGEASIDAFRRRAKFDQGPFDSASPSYSRKMNFVEKFAVLGTEAVINEKKFYGINYLTGAMTPTAHSDDKAGCGDNLPKCG